MEASKAVSSGQSEVKIADQDGFGIRKIGPESSVRIQIKKGDAIPPDVEMEGSGSGSRKSSSSSDKDK